jgi:hypothetical protein
MKALRFNQLGAYTAGLASILFFITGLAHLALLLNQDSFLSHFPILQAFQISSNITLYGLIAWAIAIPILLALAVALQLSDLVYQSGSGWVRWSVTLVLAGYAIAVIKEISDLTLALNQAQVYIGGDPLALGGFKALEKGAVDPDLALQALLIAGWFVVIHLSGLRHARLPRLQAFLGLTYAGLLLPAWIALWMHLLPAAIVTLAVQELVIGPAWYLATASVLLRQPADLSPPDD